MFSDGKSERQISRVPAEPSKSIPTSIPYGEWFSRPISTILILIPIYAFSVKHLNVKERMKMCNGEAYSVAFKRGKAKEEDTCQLTTNNK